MLTSYNVEEEKDKAELLEWIAKNEAKDAKAAEENPEEYAIVKEVRRLLSDNKTVLVLNKSGGAFFVRYFFLEYEGSKEVWSVIGQKDYSSVYYVLKLKAKIRFFIKDEEGALKEVEGKVA